MTTWRLLHLDNVGRVPMVIQPFPDETTARVAFDTARETAKREGGHIKLLDPLDQCVETYVRLA